MSEIAADPLLPGPPDPYAGRNGRGRPVITCFLAHDSNDLNHLLLIPFFPHAQTLRRGNLRQ